MLRFIYHTAINECLIQHLIQLVGLSDLTAKHVCSRWCLKWPAPSSLSLHVLFIPLLCLPSLFLSGPSTSFISPTFVSHHLIPAFMLIAQFTLFPPTFPVVSTMSYLPFFTFLHIFCLVMGFDKGILHQVLAAPAAEPNTCSHPIHTPFLIYPCKGQLLRCELEEIPLSSSQHVCVCASLSACMVIHLLEPGMLPH